VGGVSKRGQAPAPRRSLKGGGCAGVHQSVLRGEKRKTRLLTSGAMGDLVRGGRTASLNLPDHERRGRNLEVCVLLSRRIERRVRVSRQVQSVQLYWVIDGCELGAA